MEIKAWPSVAQIVEYIYVNQFDEEWNMLLAGLPRHTVEWKDRQSRKVPGSWEFQGSDRVWVEGELLPEIPAPVLPAYLERALQTFGHGKCEDGLRRIKENHPHFWSRETESLQGQHNRDMEALKGKFWVEWVKARQR